MKKKETLRAKIDAVIQSYQADRPIPKYHPDSHELDDWSLYGPKNADIANLVEHLAYHFEMQLVDIEHIIEMALRAKIAELKVDTERTD